MNRRWSSVVAGLLGTSALVVVGCGEEMVHSPVRLEQPIAAQLLVFGQHSNLVDGVPMQPDYVAYRGDGDAWRPLQATAGVVRFDIEHPRYELWVVCAGPGGATGDVQLFFLTAEDTSSPVVRCPLDVFESDLPHLDVEIADTPDQGNTAAAVAVGDVHSPNIAGTGGRLTLSFYGDGARSYDLATTLRPMAGARRLRVLRDVQLTSNPALVLDFGEAYETIAPQPLVGGAGAGRLVTYYLTGRRTTVLVHESEAAEVGVVAASIRSDDDVQIVALLDAASNGYHVSYRVDPTTAIAVLPPRTSAATVTLGSGRDLYVEGLDLGDAQLATFAVGTADAVIRLMTTTTYMNGATALTIEPPSTFDQDWRVGEVDAPFDARGSFVTGNRTVRELLDDEIFEADPPPPRAFDGFDVSVSTNGRSERLQAAGDM